MTKTTKPTATTATNNQSVNNKTMTKKVSLTFEEIQRSLKDQETIQEKQLQQCVKSNLRSLKNNIEATVEALENAEGQYEQLLQKEKVDWEAVVNKDAEIKGLEEGLKKLRILRDSLFPSWKTILIQD